MPQVAPYQMWMDLASISSAIGVSGTVTVTTSSAHGITPGAYVQVAGLTAAGTAFNAVAQVATASGSVFTYVSGTASGTATVTDGVVSYDLMNPIGNYSAGANVLNAMLLDLSSFQLTANGDGTGATMGIKIAQQVTPAAGPWFTTAIPDNTRFRFVKKETGQTPDTDKSDVLFLGVLVSLSSQLNEAGQGTETSVDLADVNYLLDKSSVFGKLSSARTVTATKVSRTGNVATIDFGRVAHGFVVGQAIKVGGVIGGSSSSSPTTRRPFTGIYRVASVPTAYTLTYPNTGTGVDQTGVSSANVSMAASAKTPDRITVTDSNTIGILDGDTVKFNFIGTLTGFSNARLFKSLMDQTFSGDRVKRVSDTEITLIFSSPYTGGFGTVTSGATNRISTVPTVSDAKNNNQLVVTIAGGLSETDSVKEFIGVVGAYKDADPAFQRLLATTDYTQIIGATDRVNEDAIQFSASTLRSALDTIIEQFSGSDVKLRRYHIDPQGRMNYKLVDLSVTPTYPDAPYVITTASYGEPNKTDGPASIAAANLRVTLDHDTTKNALFSIPSTSGTTITNVYAYDDLLDSGGTAIYAERPGAPRFDAVVDFPTQVKNAGARMVRAAAAFYVERHKPLLSGSFKLVGAGTVSGTNNLGFISGYGAQTVGTISSASRTGSVVTITTGAAHSASAGKAVVIAGITGASGTTMNGTFTIGTAASTTTFNYTSSGSAGTGTIDAASGYVYREVSWKPGQYVSVDAANLGISAATLYRVEEVTLTLVPGSYLQEVDVTFSRKNPSDLSTLIASLNK